MGAVALFGGLVAALILYSIRRADAKTKVVYVGPETEVPLTPDLDRDVVEAVEEKIDEVIPILDSPLSGVSKEPWTRFVLKQKRGRLSTISAGYNLGYFLFDARSLQDLGYMQNVHKVDYNGRSVYDGEWKSPYSLQGFLSSGKLQYEAFSALTKKHSKYIQSHFQKYLGTTIEGKPVTLSGLLGLSWQAGLRGAEEWLKGNRKPATTSAYLRTTGIF